MQTTSERQVRARERTCFDCGELLPDGASFCSNCGRQILKRSERVQRDANREGQKNAEQALLAESKAAYDKLRASITEDATESNKATRAVSWVCLATLPIVYFVDQLWCFASLAGFGFFVTRKQDPDRRLSKGEYYSLAGSRFGNGDHRCIFCGAKGIFRKGVYAADTTLAGCSKCSEPLFYE